MMSIFGLRRFSVLSDVHVNRLRILLCRNCKFSESNDAFLEWPVELRKGGIIIDTRCDRWPGVWGHDDRFVGVNLVHICI